MPSFTTNVIIAGNYDVTTAGNIKRAVVIKDFALTIDKAFVTIQNDLIVGTGQIRELKIKAR
jgi:hypothetical protein